MATPLLGKFLGIVSGLSLGTRTSNLKSVSLTVLELLAFNSHDRPLRTHKQTHIERTHYLRHSLRSLGGDNNLFYIRWSRWMQHKASSLTPLAHCSCKRQLTIRVRKLRVCVSYTYDSINIHCKLLATNLILILIHREKCDISRGLSENMIKFSENLRIDFQKFTEIS